MDTQVVDHETRYPDPTHNQRLDLSNVDPQQQSLDFQMLGFQHSWFGSTEIETNALAILSPFVLQP